MMLCVLIKKQNLATSVSLLSNQHDVLNMTLSVVSCWLCTGLTVSPHIHDMKQLNTGIAALGH